MPAWAGRRARRCHVLSAANSLRVLGAEDPEACLDSSWAMPILPARCLAGLEFVALPRGAMLDVRALSTLAGAQVLPVHMFTIQNPGPGPRKRGRVPHPPRAPVKHWTWDLTGPGCASRGTEISLPSRWHTLSSKPWGGSHSPLGPGSHPEPGLGGTSLLAWRFPRKIVKKVAGSGWSESRGVPPGIRWGELSPH